MKRLIPLLLIIAVPALAAPASWSVDPSQSRIEFAGKHAGQGFTGKFSDWRAVIAFDPAALDQSSASVTVAIASAKTGDNYKDGTLPQDEWLDAKHFPEARFEAKAFKAMAEGKYEALGTLTIKGQSVPLTLPFTLKIDGADAVMSGAATLDRVALNIGTKSDPGAEWVSREITVNVTVKAHREAR